MGQISVNQTGTQRASATLNKPRWSVTPQAFRYICFATVVTVTLLIVSGGAVRLSGSGLGCPDWPSCTQHHFVAAVQFHPMVEFINRVFNIILSITIFAAMVASLFRYPRRKDLVLLSAGLVFGVIVQIVLGGLVVLFKLAPTLVMIHFMATIAMVADAVVLYHRSNIDPTPAKAMVRPEIVWLGRITIAVVALVIAAGTAVTGSGPHAGSIHAVRLPFPFRSMAELHADIVLFLIGLTLATQFALRLAEAPPGVQRRARLMLEVMVAQGVLGYTQYFLHVPALLVEFHLLGASLVWVFTLRYYLGLFVHPPLHDQPTSDLIKSELAGQSA